MIKTLIPALLVSAALTGCTGLFSIHQIDIQQGNALTTEQMASISEGMTRDEVVKTLGQPMLKPVFTAERWDYVYYLKKPDVAAEERIVSVYFSDNQISRIVR